MPSGRVSPPPNPLIREGWVLRNLVFFSWWSQWQAAVERWSRRSRMTLLGVAMTVGIVARLWAQSLPGNWDFGQWINVSTAALNGQDPYALYGYNYPPPWLATLTLFNAVTSSDEAFRLLIALLLTAADIGIALLLVRRGYLLAAAVFLISPITIAISGQHQQVEGISLFLALAGALLLTTSSKERFSKVDWAAVLLIGLSLSFKPIFLVFPLWLAMRPGPVRRRLLVLCAPLVVFGIVLSSAFVFYPVETVLSKVLGHGGANNSPLINTFVPGQFAPWVLEHGGGKVAFLIIMVVAGLMFRRLEPFEGLLAYTLTAVTFSWAVVNQYLSTPVTAVAVYLNIGLLIWMALATIYLGGDASVLNLWVLRDIQPHLLLEWEAVMQDLFPWLLIGWVLFAIGIRTGWVYLPVRLVRSSTTKV